MVFLGLVTGLALAILYPTCSAEMELLHKRARTNAPNIPAQIVSVDDIDSDGAEWSALVSAEVCMWLGPSHRQAKHNERLFS